MIRSVIRHLFPPARRQSKLPLLSRQFSSTNDPQLAIKFSSQQIAMLKTYNLARTDQDAIRILNRYPDWDTAQIIKELRRKRRPGNRWSRAWRRLKKLW